VPGGELRRLVLAQDTGGAIRGAVAGDMFWGYGDEAGRLASGMQARGRYFMLLPRSATDVAGMN
jgi:membrane-bound lytic murein transglycosylase A